MEITWYGMSCFRLTERKMATVITDPYNGKLGLPPLKLKADVVTSSHEAVGHRYLTDDSNYSQAIPGQGEYEIGVVFITGEPTHRKPEQRENVLFVITYDNITVAHLGDIDQVPSQSQLEALGQIHVLLLPVGSGKSLNASQAAEIVSMLEPNIVIPMHYSIDGLKVELEEVDRFLKEMGVTEPKVQSSLKISSSSLPEETDTILLTPKL